MKANSCNMQELWLLNKKYCTCASDVMFTGCIYTGDTIIGTLSCVSGGMAVLERNIYSNRRLYFSYFLSESQLIHTDMKWILYV